MLNGKVSLHDIEDVEAFVIMCTKRSGCNAPPEAWQDLVAEGICLLFAMEKNYKPKLPGYSREGCFSGYAVKWLPKQIAQAWHKSQEHHLYTKDGITGKRGWTYRLTPVSYENVIQRSQREHGGREEVRLLRINEFVEVPTHISTE